MTVDISTIKNPRKRPKDVHRLHRWLSIAMQYYRLTYVVGYNEKQAYKEIEEKGITYYSEEFKKDSKEFFGIATIQKAVEYFDDKTHIGRKRIDSSGYYGVYTQYKVIGKILENRIKVSDEKDSMYTVNGKPIPEYLADLIKP
jgi:hypothetical protein